MWSGIEVGIALIVVAVVTDLTQNTQEKRLSANPRFDVCRRPSCLGFNQTAVLRVKWRMDSIFNSESTFSEFLIWNNLKLHVFFLCSITA